MKSALAQAYLIVITSFLFGAIVQALMYLSEGEGGKAVIALGVAALFYMLLPTLEEPEREESDPYDI